MSSHKTNKLFYLLLLFAFLAVEATAEAREGAGERRSLSQSTPIDLLSRNFSMSLGTEIP